MERVDRIKSILSEIEYGYIGYSNLHENDDEGLDIIKEALEKMVPKKPKRSGKNEYLTCPSCGILIVKGCGCHNNDCCQRIDWSEVE